MRCRLKRRNVKLDRQASDSDKDFFLSFTDCYILESVIDYFGMDTLDNTPDKHYPMSDAPAGLYERAKRISILLLQIMWLLLR